ncbi:MAG TPA: hypothetical protein VGX68_00990, partial [Thermoanaerobaculia bacterium]|nr:hypothetical protein [Thermoanaerobaculia bacterium]
MGAGIPLSRLLGIPPPEREKQSSFNYDWALLKAERSLASKLKPPLVPEALAELDSLSEGEQVRRARVEDRYANPEFIYHLLEKGHDVRYRSSRRMLHLARLAHLAAEACTIRAAGGERQLADLRAWAWGQYANALRISSQPIEAGKAFSIALHYRAQGTGDLKLHAWLLQRTTALATLQNRFDDALKMCEKAGTIYQELGESHLFASTSVQLAIATLY